MSEVQIFHRRYREFEQAAAQFESQPGEIVVLDKAYHALRAVASDAVRQDHTLEAPLATAMNRMRACKRMLLSDDDTPRPKPAKSSDDDNAWMKICLFLPQVSEFNAQFDACATFAERSTYFDAHYGNIKPVVDTIRLIAASVDLPDARQLHMRRTLDLFDWLAYGFQEEERAHASEHVAQTKTQRKKSPFGFFKILVLIIILIKSTVLLIHFPVMLACMVIIIPCLALLIGVMK